MAIVNMPFEKNDEAYHNEEFNKLPLAEAKKMFPNVSLIDFKNACIQACIPHFLIDLYYMHYLGILGDVVRMRNFKFDLEQRNIDIAKLVNYNKVERFNYGSVLHTCATWNNDPTMIEFLKDECDGDFEVKDRYGYKVYSIYFQSEVYTNPFLDILGYGERPFDFYNIFRRDHYDFGNMDNFLESLQEEQEEREDREDREEEEEEEEEEENIEVNEPPPLNHYHPPLQRQNAVVFDEEDVNNGPDYIPLPELEENEIPEDDLPPLIPRRLFNENEPMEVVEPLELQNQEQPEPNNNEYIQENRMNNKLVTVINNLFPNDNEVVENVIGTLKVYKVFTVEDFIDSKLRAGDLEACGIENEEVLDVIWTYIEEHSPNFVHGGWVN